ncbi:Uncharacterised protein [BD1-7 clade bacterium]|uniref:Multidrug export protein MepA n=1 Tax=BD1-7 clade bacterium TaxID=2029982 RepID=A0A5S9R151_9GAMM|nr:Uncharacterised protein [BD1-7 clade bacterium]
MPNSTAVFTRGSIMNHIVVMASTNALGLLSLFLVDLVDMYFLSLLGQETLAAAVGFAGTLLFFLTALSIGLQIGVSALVARAEGRRDRESARIICANGVLLSFVTALVVSMGAFIYVKPLLMFLGAKGQTLSYALEFSVILLPSTAVLSVAMVLAAVLRALGNARYSTLAIVAGSAVNAVLDPLFIFVFGWGIEGAAAASVAARFSILIIAVVALQRRYQFLQWPDLSRFKVDVVAIGAVAGPAVLTNLATPIGSTYVMKEVASFGTDAVAAAAIIGRIVPVAFAGLFALSGAIGPIVAQNASAMRIERVKSTFSGAGIVTVGYCLVIWGALTFLHEPLNSLFSASPQAAELITQFCLYLSPLYVFSGLLFIANACFNNLHKAYIATLFNFSRALLGTIPLVFLLAPKYGAIGVLAGELLGSVIFGTLAFIVLWVRSPGWIEVPSDAPTDVGSAPVNPLSSQQCQLGQECEVLPASDAVVETPVK